MLLKNICGLAARLPNVTNLCTYSARLSKRKVAYEHVHLRAVSLGTTTVAATRLPGVTPYSARALRTPRTADCSTSKCSRASASTGALSDGHGAAISASPAGGPEKTSLHKLVTQGTAPNAAPEDPLQFTASE